jgi:hypothetical protein
VGIQRHLPRILAQLILVVILSFSSNAAEQERVPRFYADDPVCCAPKPLNSADVKARKTDTLFDFLYNSFAQEAYTDTPAEGINTLGEALDSEWFTNRHGRKRLSVKELKQGVGDGQPPRPPYLVIGAKLDGITPGFRMRDSEGTVYFVKPDPLKNPELATAADAMGARFFHAIGYNTPENYITHVRLEDMTVSPEATRIGDSGKPRPMTIRDIESILWKVPRAADRSYRMIASRAIPGAPAGPFRYKGTRADDPNDVIPHQNRRDLRGLFVFCAWLNHTDAKSINSLDTLVNEGGRKYIRHYLIDFGSAFGSDSDMPKNARFGNGYVIPSRSEVTRGILNLGIPAEPWERADHPEIAAVGRFEASAFEPEKWLPNYPNPAFAQRMPEDEYWAAKIVMSFTDDDIRAIVETAQYTDPLATEYITKTLIARRDRIGRTYFVKVLPLEEIRVVNERLEFKDLAVALGFVPPRDYDTTWFHLDNTRGVITPIAGAATTAIPKELAAAPVGDYFATRVSMRGDPAKQVTVFLRKTDREIQVVGIDRNARRVVVSEAATPSTTSVAGR